MVTYQTTNCEAVLLGIRVSTNSSVMDLALIRVIKKEVYRIIPITTFTAQKFCESAKLDVPICMREMLRLESHRWCRSVASSVGKPSSAKYF